MHQIRYKLDGTPSNIVGSAPGPTTFVLKRMAAWEGQDLVITETMLSGSLNGGKPFTTTARLSLSEGRLTIEGVRANKDGTEDKYRAVYVKKPNKRVFDLFRAASSSVWADLQPSAAPSPEQPRQPIVARDICE